MLADAHPAPEAEPEEAHVRAELAVRVEPPLRVKPLGLWVDVRVARDGPGIIAVTTARTSNVEEAVQVQSEDFSARGDHVVFLRRRR